MQPTAYQDCSYEEVPLHGSRPTFDCVVRLTIEEASFLDKNHGAMRYIGGESGKIMHEIAQDIIYISS